MYFGFSAEHEQLRSLTRSVLERECSTAVVRSAPDAPALRALWRRLGEIGALGVLIPEELGGLGLDEVGMVALLIEAGRVALPLPALEALALAGPLLAGRIEHRSTLASLLRGEVSVAADPAGAGCFPHGRTAAYVLTGGWAGVGSIHLAALDTGHVEPVVSVDPTRGLVRRTGPVGEPIADGPEVLRAWRRAVLGTAAELVGLARRMLDMAARYVRERRQFGVAVGSFQAVQHALADALVQIEFAEPAVLRAGHSMATGSPDAGRDVSMAKALASAAASAVARTALQCHGALGYTVEYDLHLFLKRTWALAEAWGAASWHRREVGRALSLTPY
ncbi:acyl-CoA dehydrogenase family protein [Dactylosporangium fulvum]|uniref:Acyl-CoA/acyl-ACP dehydrogenase n=1 Tax=Dactylosporangium fulvum TaxID=53359 RepID=A0ABY5W6M3_9ACTN|nr:acyl-CoA dehydrogenase family protein [Dactylosporangium fulvum]UWP85645.1 acyl-CoA/acyl-ACP dehydrogenase [Dactylosporangium fulvum]